MCCRCFCFSLPSNFNWCAFITWSCKKKQTLNNFVSVSPSSFFPCYHETLYNFKRSHANVLFLLSRHPTYDFHTASEITKNKRGNKWHDFLGSPAWNSMLKEKENFNQLRWQKDEDETTTNTMASKRWMNDRARRTRPICQKTTRWNSFYSC